MHDSFYIQQVLAGHTDAFRMLYRNYAASAWQLAIGICKNRHWAEDAVQNAFVQAFRHLHSFKELSSFKTWLMRIVFRECLAKLKNEQKRRWDEFSPGHETEPDWTPQEPSDSMHFERREQVQTVLQQLNVKESLILNLFYMHELSLKETAEVTGYSESNVKVILHRARKSFKTIYKNL